MKREFESGDKAMPRTVYAAETAWFRADKLRLALAGSPRKSENPRNERI